MHPDLETTLALADATGLAVERARIEQLYSIPTLLTEWSLNAASDPRGVLRMVVISEATSPASSAANDSERKLLAALGETRCLELHDELGARAGGGLVGMGYSFRSGAAPRFRYYRSPAAGDETRFAELAVGALQIRGEERDEYDRIVEACGGEDRCVACGVEMDERASDRTSERISGKTSGRTGEPGRFTLYFEVRDRAAAIRLLQLVGCPPSLGANLFFKALCGMDRGMEGGMEGNSPHSFPKVWVARSQGKHGGWKFYYFARGEPARPTDAALLDLVSADAPLMTAWRRLAASCEGRPVVQLIALRFSDQNPAELPRWTVYLGRA